LGSGLRGGAESSGNEESWDLEARGKRLCDVELPRAGGRKRGTYLLLLHKCDRQTMSFPAGSGGCGGEGYGYNRTISTRGLRQRNGGSRGHTTAPINSELCGHTVATARLTPEGAMRPPNLDADACSSPTKLLSRHLHRLQVAAESMWICQFDEDQASGGKLRQQDLAWGSQSSIVRLVCGRFAGEGIKLGLEEWLHRAVLAASPNSPRADGGGCGRRFSRGPALAAHEKSGSCTTASDLPRPNHKSGHTDRHLPHPVGGSGEFLWDDTVAGAGSARRERSGIRGAAPIQSLMPHCPQHNRRHTGGRWPTYLGSLA
jgi:hypothetical protein